jgi:hypothetical protein
LYRFWRRAVSGLQLLVFDDAGADADADAEERDDAGLEGLAGLNRSPKALPLTLELGEEGLDGRVGVAAGEKDREGEGEGLPNWLPGVLV